MDGSTKMSELADRWFRLNDMRRLTVASELIGLLCGMEDAEILPAKVAERFEEMIKTWE